MPEKFSNEGQKKEPEFRGLDEPEAINDQEPAKIIRCDLFGYDAPRCYSENTSKEELVLEHVLEYDHQFKVIYDPIGARKPLLLAPKNERGTRKFICTTIRPTKLPYTELYEWDNCAKFISDYLEYEELPIPDRFPDVIPSPANVLDWQAGDCFDCSIVLCSLLIGAGYDAFVVYGTAPKFITTKDESLMDCPFSLEIPEDNQSDDAERDDDEHLMEIEKKDKLKPVEDFEVIQIGAPVSVFDRGEEEKKNKELHIQRIKDTVIDDDEPDYQKEDEYGRSRLHAWVLIQKGKREMPESFFVEPSTGRRYNLDEAPYYSIEAIFNNKNFWINMDETREIKEINFDFENDNTGEWEYVMINTDDKKGDDEDENAEEDEDDDDDGGGNNEEEVLDMPPPWSPKLFVNKDKFAELCPKGEKTVFYKKCRVEFYSDCKQVDGLVKKVTIYEDYKKIIVKEVRSYFKHRRDKLILRRRFPYKFTTIEHYESSEKQNYWKKLIQKDDQYRKIFFYHHRVKDCLIYREEQIGKKTFERFKGREDRLIYRSVTYDPDKLVDEAVHLFIDDKHYQKKYCIKKMAQKFELDPNRPAEEQIRKTEFNIEKNLVLIYYHYKEGQIFRQPDKINRLDLVSHGKMGDMNEKDVEKDNDENKKQQFFKQINEMEQKCQSQIKSNEEIAHTERNQRRDNEKSILQLRMQPVQEDIFTKILEKSIYEKARDRMKLSKKNVDDEAQEKTEKDHLLPILKKLSLENKGDLDEEAAIHVKNEALKNLKERLLTRAEIIQRRLAQEQQKLEQAFNNLKRKGEAMTPEDEQKYDNDIHKANFRIDILTERASLHYRQSLRRFEQLDKDLTNDPRLKVLLKNK